MIADYAIGCFTLAGSRRHQPPLMLLLFAAADAAAPIFRRDVFAAFARAAAAMMPALLPLLIAAATLPYLRLLSLFRCLPPVAWLIAYCRYRHASDWLAFASCLVFDADCRHDFAIG